MLFIFDLKISLYFIIFIVVLLSSRFENTRVVIWILNDITSNETYATIDLITVMHSKLLLDHDGANDIS